VLHTLTHDDQVGGSSFFLFPGESPGEGPLCCHVLGALGVYTYRYIGRLFFLRPNGPAMTMSLDKLACLCLPFGDKSWSPRLHHTVQFRSLGPSDSPMFV
jgi:hypothetical protein